MKERVNESAQQPFTTLGIWSGISLPLKPIVRFLQLGSLSVGIGLLNGVAQAATITVDNTADADAGCTLREAIVSANNAALETDCANSGGGFGNDTIVFGGSLSSGGTITLSAGQLSLSPSKTLTIDASTTGEVSVIAAPNDRVFFVHDSASLTVDTLDISGGNTLVDVNGGGVYLGDGANLRIYDSTLRNNTSRKYGGAIFIKSNADVIIDNSNITQNIAFKDGGGIYSSSFGSNVITLTDSFVTNNVAQNDEGGGIWSSVGDTISLNNTQVTGNSSGTQGGGIFAIRSTVLDINTGSSISFNESGISPYGGHGGGLYFRSLDYGNQLLIQNSSVSNNSASGAPGVYTDGGGIYFKGYADSYGNYDVLILDSTTVTGNSATGSGGGIFSTNEGSVTVYNSTLSGNSSSKRGGGLYSRYSSVTLNNSTLTGNSAVHGGGIFLGDSSSVTLNNSIVAGNIAPDFAELANYSTNSITTNGHNLFGHIDLDNSEAFKDFTPCTSDICATSNGNNPITLDSILDPNLANNGGPTHTHALMADSPAINGAKGADCPPEDQRGEPRDKDGLFFPIVTPDKKVAVINLEGECDIGSFEEQ